MTEVACYYRGCEFNKSDTCTLKEIAVSGNIHCMTAISKEEAAEMKAEGDV